MSAPTSIDICSDCLMVIANGELWDEDGNDIANAHDEKINAYLGSAEVSLGHHRDDCEWCAAVYDGSDSSPCDEGRFSWSSCDACNSPLGGDRYPATRWDTE